MIREEMNKVAQKTAERPVRRSSARLRTVKSLSTEREIWFVTEGLLPGSDESAAQSAMQQV
jgi:hypothetical protein